MPLPPPEDDDGETARINLRLPGQLKAGVECAAGAVVKDSPATW
jgi:hypothetical protein